MKSCSDFLSESIGEQRTVYAMNYIYCGVVKEVFTDAVLLDPVACVYNTGSHESESFADCKKFPHGRLIPFTAIESIGAFKSIKFDL